MMNVTKFSGTLLLDFSGLKKYSNWPTYPQLYGNGELIGGLDIIKELVESGELESQLPQQEKLEDRLVCVGVFSVKSKIRIQLTD